MSIVTLKKKTQSKYNNNSVGFTNFSLYGSYRNQGYVGQTSLSRSLPRTLARGNTLRGYGGCCGTFHITPSVLSAVTSTEDNRVIKSSVLDNDGMIATKYRWIRRPAPITAVKSDNNNNNTTAQDYINHISTKTVNEINTCNQGVVKSKIICNKSCPALPSNAGGSLYKNKGVSITKPDMDYKSFSYGQYLLNINKKCSDSYTYSIKNVNTKNPPKSSQRTPIPISSN
jgi:hypothetical protein